MPEEEVQDGGLEKQEERQKYGEEKKRQEKVEKMVKE